MVIFDHILLLMAAYLTGSISSAVWVGKLFYNKDVREYGSGNAGATNTFRVLGKGAGIPVLFMDIFKGWLVVHYVHLISNSEFLSEELLHLQVTCNPILDRFSRFVRQRPAQSRRCEFPVLF